MNSDVNKSSSFVKSFFIAIILAVVSFFIIFFLFPNVSEKYFGVSLKSSPEVADMTEELSEKTNDTVKKINKSVVENFLKK